MKKLTLVKNFWLCLEKNVIQPVCRKIHFLHFFFRSEEPLGSKVSRKATLKEKFVGIFFCVCKGCSKTQPKKWNFDQKRINFIHIFVALTKITSLKKQN